MVKGKIKFRKIVHIKRMMVYDRFADKMKECTCFKVNVLDLVKYFEDFSCHESDGYFEVYSDNVKICLNQKDQEELKEFQVHDIGTPNDSTDLELCNFYQSDQRNNDRLLDNVSVREGQIEAHGSTANLSQNSSILKCTLQRENTDDKHTHDQEAGVAHTSLAVHDEGDASSSKEKGVVSSLNDASILRDKNISNQLPASSSRTYFDWNRVIRKAEKSGYHEFREFVA